MTTLIHKTVLTYLKRLQKALLKRNQLKQVVLLMSAIKSHEQSNVAFQAYYKAIHQEDYLL
jgi:hypothetical protein